MIRGLLVVVVFLACFSVVGVGGEPVTCEDGDYFFFDCFYVRLSNLLIYSFILFILKH